jgi:CDP-glycerol glycerophosphotransferase (TagB/SpsB family)
MPIIIAAAKLFFGIIYAFMKLRPVERKAVFLSRQGDAPSVDYARLAAALEAAGIKTEMYLQRQEKDAARFMGNAGASLRMILRQMKALATAKVAVTDGYSIPISVLKHRSDVKIIQIWHAVGAVKKFGLQTLPVMEEGERKRALALKMHAGYDYFAAPSAAAADFFAEAFGMYRGRALITGTPYLDALYGGELAEPKEGIAEALPALAENERLGRPRRVVLYVPTYREGGGSADAVRALAAALDPGRYILVVKSHPIENGTELAPGNGDNGAGNGDNGTGLASNNGDKGPGNGDNGTEFAPNNGEQHITNNGEQHTADNAAVFASAHTAESLIHAADAVITDYSSLAITAALAGKPLFFYLYDVDEYRLAPGLNIDPEREYGRYAARDAAELARIMDGSLGAGEASAADGRSGAGDIPAMPSAPYDKAYEAAFAERYVETYDGRCTERLAAAVKGFV